MAYATILTETRDRVRYVTLNRSAVPADQLADEVHHLASRVAMIPHDLLAANKGIVNKAIELMGRTMLQEAARETDAIAHRNRAASEFARSGREQGLRAALAWRDDRFARSVRRVGPDPNEGARTRGT